MVLFHQETPSPDPLMPEAKQRAPVSCEREHRIVLETVKQVLQQIKHFAAKHSLDGLDYEACKEAATELISQWGITPANNATSPTNNAVSPANNAGQKTTDNKADSGKEDRDSGTGEEIESSRESRQGSIQESTRSNDGLDGQVRSWQEFKSLYANNEVNVSYKIKSGIKHLNRFVAAVEKFEKVSPNIYSRLVKVQKYHLYKYCVSLAQEPNAYEVRSIREYDERICEYEKDIDSKMTSINNLYNQYNDLKSPFLGFVANGFEVSDIINTISGHIRDVCALMRKWVDDDKAYPERLWNEIIFSHLQRENIQSDIAKYHDKCDDIRMSLHKRELQRQKIIQRLDVLRKDRKKTRKSLETIDMQIERNQSEMDKRLREIDDMESQMSRRKSNSPAYFNRITTKTDQLRQDIDRMEHWHDTHSKQRERLAKKKDEVCGEISLLEKELEIHNLAQKDLHASLDANESKLDKHYEKLKKHHAHVNALKRTRDNKMSSLVLKKIYHKKLTEENKGKILILSKEKYTQFHLAVK